MEAAESVPAFMAIRETDRAGRLSVTDGTSVSSEHCSCAKSWFPGSFDDTADTHRPGSRHPVSSSIPESGRKHRCHGWSLFAGL